MKNEMVHNEKGLLSLEASISVTLFIFLMLFLYSFFVVFEVRNEIGHALLATANSMSIDAFTTSTLASDTNLAVDFFYDLYGTKADAGTTFVNHTAWYDTADFTEILKKRFFSYLCGANHGDTSGAGATILKKYHVVDGVDGIKFDGSKVEDGKLYLTVTYTVEMEYKVFNFGQFKFEQSACSKLWK
ncbi:MAG: hypothetical protein IK081_13350 [Lachnospiraceae bacterium]|nr:hypothetical protein [Lachnospiraceae bacterium]